MIATYPNLETNHGFGARRVATAGCEILDPKGRVIAWSVDEFWAVMILKGLDDDKSTVGHEQN